MHDYRVRDAQEAVELAHELKAKGQYDWFRGQVRDWPPWSSLFRVRQSRDPDQNNRSELRISMFRDWIQKIPELRHLLENQHTDDLFAIMQHYGIATHYIDFTTDPGVAGFFAADTKTPPKDGQACIYCLDTKDLLELWDDLKDEDERKGATIETVTPNVRNLWRLQAQSGVFLFADYNWDVDYPMDRILFPYSGYPPYPTSDRIYPEHKSSLEQLLDQYFELEKATFFADEMRRWFANRTAPGGRGGIMPWHVWKDGYNPKAFVDASGPKPLESWNEEALQAWMDTPNENYHETTGLTLRLRLNSGADGAQARKLVSFGVNEALRSQPEIRTKAVDWVFDDVPDGISSNELSKCVRPVWNGMRRVPYTDSQIAEALGTVVALRVLGFSHDASSEQQFEVFTTVIGPGLRVAFSNFDGSGSVGLVSLERLAQALRQDMNDLITKDFSKFVTNVRDFFRFIYNPRLMFDFNELKEAFSQEIIPTQALMGRSPMLFNPAHLRIFGLP